MAGTGIGYDDASGPEGVRVYAIGDIHGRLDLLEKMHGLIDADRAGYPGKDWLVIHVGDYVDRGPDSRGVIDFLISAADRDPRYVSLGGNHDVGFLDFLSDPRPDGLFARHGGRQTALSYGVDIDFDDPRSLAAGRAALDAAMPARHRAFLEGLHFSFTAGDCFFCHAGIRPHVALDRQAVDDLIWIRDVFLDFSGLHEKVIVHGHTPANEPEVRANRVNVDTGAFRTGRLTAFVIDGRDKDFMTATAR